MPNLNDVRRVTDHGGPYPYTSTHTWRLGQRMHACIAHLNANPEISQHALSLAVGPNHSNAFGYQIVMRCEAAGLLVRELRTETTPAGRKGSYALHLTELGHILASQDVFTAFGWIQDNNAPVEREHGNLSRVEMLCSYGALA